MIENLFITDFENPCFTQAFKTYFSELGIRIKNWDKLWEEMNSDSNFAFIKVIDNRKALGFIQCQIIKSQSWFFEEKCGFIREFWVDKEHRNLGYGSELLSLAENYFYENNIKRYILTTDTAENFYIKNGYKKRTDIIAKNKMTVFVKEHLH